MINVCYIALILVSCGLLEVFSIPTQTTTIGPQTTTDINATNSSLLLNDTSDELPDVLADDGEVDVLIINLHDIMERGTDEYEAGENGNETSLVSDNQSELLHMTSGTTVGLISNDKNKNEHLKQITTTASSHRRKRSGILSEPPKTDEVSTTKNTLLTSNRPPSIKELLEPIALKKRSSDDNLNKFEIQRY
ncbi:uncharacterized protein LOC142328996 isoform X2 [Lycorma delicatula]|uniref:uncharacterized protein LOC142328996 isoform X2 n=1 Tax=Lycorma delicatula TaxID=130591 RepID=UPI003F5197C8